MGTLPLQELPCAPYPTGQRLPHYGPGGSDRASRPILATRRGIRLLSGDGGGGREPLRRLRAVSPSQTWSKGAIERGR